MKDAPKEIWAETLNDWVGPGGYWDTSPNADSDLPDVKYIRADIAADRIEQLEAERDAAHKRGLEDAAKIADGFGYAVEVSEAIRAKIQERVDGWREGRLDQCSGR